MHQQGQGAQEVRVRFQSVYHCYPKQRVIIGALNIPQNDYDGHTLDTALEQQQRLTGHKLSEAFADRGYRGRKQVNGTIIHTPKPFSSKLTTYRKTRLKRGHTKRAAIEPKIGHLKTDRRLSRNFCKGVEGDNINVMLAAAAMNFKRMMNIWKEHLLSLFLKFFLLLNKLTIPTVNLKPQLNLTF